MSRRPRKPTDIVPLQLRLPEAMRKQIAADAERNQRSLNSEIVWRLDQTMDGRWTEYVANMERQAEKDQAFLAELKADPERRAILENVVRDLLSKKRKGDA